MSSPPEWVNAKQASGEHRISHAALFDDEVRPHNERFRAAAGVAPGDRVLDVGCGTGQSTREAARAAAGGSALGVDLSAQAVELARQLSEQEGLRNVFFRQADAQVHRFPPRHFDLCISRFGTMFFADPVAGFANIGTSLRPGGRLVMLVWQARDRNEWSTAIRRAIAGPDAFHPDQPAQVPDQPAQVPDQPAQIPDQPVQVPDQPLRGPDPFALGDPAFTRRILAAAGFAEVCFAGVDEPVYYGQDPAVAYDLVLGLRDPKDLLAGMDAAAAGRARERLRATLAEHDTGSGVLFGSRAWIVTARRP
jgi:SAM-dependent methyltransferase